MKKIISILHLLLLSHLINGQPLIRVSQIEPIQGTYIKSLGETANKALTTNGSGAATWQTLSFLPLAGGTLAGVLNGTSAIFTGDININGNDIFTSGTDFKININSSNQALRLLRFTSWTDSKNTQILQFGKAGVLDSVMITGGNGTVLNRFGISASGIVLSSNPYTTMQVPTSYFNVYGTSYFSQALTSANTITGTRLISTQSTGTAPLSVSSTTVVNNLNSDYLDGQHGSYYQPFLTNPVTGTGSAGFLTKFTGIGNAVENSPLFASGDNVALELDGAHYISGSEVTKTRFGDLLGGGSAVALSYNLSYSATEFNLDETLAGGVLLTLNPSIPFRLRITTAGSNPRTLSELFRITSSGDFGIGIINPLARLHTYTTTSGPVAIFESTGSTGYITFKESGTIRGYLGYGGDGNLFNGATSNSLSLRSEADLHLGGSGNYLTMTLTGSKVGIGLVAPTSQLTQKAPANTELPTYGSELLSVSNWTSTGWTGDWATGWTHSTGNTTVLSNTLTATATAYYQVTWTVSNRTAGSFAVSFGGVSSAVVTAQTVSSAMGVYAETTGNLTITPTTDFNGKIVISIKSISSTITPAYAIQNSGSATNSFELRQGSLAGQNIFMGYGTGKYTTTGNANVALGYNSMAANTSGYYNTAIGYNALYANTLGGYNVAVGWRSLYANKYGNTNTAVGHYSLYQNTSGGGNIAIGGSSLYANTTANSNTSVGYSSMVANTTGSLNTAVGYAAISGNTDGSSNIAIGYAAGSYYSTGTALNTTSDFSTYLGRTTRAGASGNQNETVIGYNAVGDGSNTVRLGNTSVTGVYTSGFYQGTTGKFTGLTDAFFAYHVSDATGLADSPIKVSSGLVVYNAPPTMSDVNQLAPKSYVDAVAAGNLPKTPVEVATTGNITLSGTQTIDGYTAVTGNRVLVWKQTTVATNGVYVVAAGAWARAADMDTWAEIYKAYVAVLNGAQSGSSFVCTIPVSGTLETTDVSWVLYTAPTNILAGDGLTKTGNTFTIAWAGTGTAGTSSRSDHTQAFSTITSTPTTLSGYGITDAANSSHTQTAGTITDFHAEVSANSEVSAAFAGRISSLTTNNSSGAATFSGNILNIPNYTLAGLGGIGLTSLSSTATGLKYTNTTGVFSFTAGYEIPTSAVVSNSITAYNDRPTALAVSTGASKTITITQGDGTTLTSVFTDNVDDADNNTSNEGTLGVWTAGTNQGLITSNTSGSSGVTIIGGTNITITPSTSSNGGSLTIDAEDGMSDPMTTAGDMIYRTSGNTTARLPAGSPTQVLTMYMGTPSWNNLAGGQSGNIQYSNGAGGLSTDPDITYSSATNSLIVTGNITSGNFILNSDRRLKNNIQPIGDISWVDDVHFKTFYMNNDLTGRLRYGVVAQELETVNPFIVSTAENGYKAVSYIDLLIAKVARQDEILNKLIKQIEKFEKHEN